jgi:hypothetical protein
VRVLAASRRPHRHCDRVAGPGCHRDGLSAERDLDPVLAKDVRHGVGDIRVFSGKQARAALDHCHAAAETAEHLAELQADVAASEHDVVVGNLVELHDARGVEGRDRVQTRDRRASGTCAHVEDDEG